MDIFTAVQVAEGDPGFKAMNREGWVAAFQTIIDSGTTWKLNRWFVKTAAELFQTGECHLPDDGKRAGNC